MSQTGFAEAAVAKIPQRVCIGVVDEVPEGKLSSSEKYVVQPIKIRALGPGRSLRVNVLYRPEWLDRTFDPNSLTEYEGGDSMLFVYRNNIAGKDSTSVLKGLSGSAENFNALAEGLLSLEDKSIPNVTQVLRDRLVDNETPFLYVLKQAKQQVGTDEAGKKIYELTKNYEVSEFHFLTPENIKKMKNRAARRTDGQFLIAFDEDEY